MAYYVDLSAYTYYKPEPQSVNIGWLTRGYAYSTGDTSDEFLARLSHYCPGRVNVTRGIHHCELCTDPQSAKHQAEVNWLGSAEIRVFYQGKVYAAPNLIYHYVTQHDYRPPAEFIEAVLNGPLPGTSAYEALIQQVDADYWLDKDSV